MNVQYGKNHGFLKDAYTWAVETQGFFWLGVKTNIAKSCALQRWLQMEIRFNLWIEEGGEVALSLWRVNLLKAIADTGSINAAAEQLDIPYRTAWEKVHEMETRLGVKLLETHTGGAHGGGAQITPEAKAYIKKLENLYDRLAPLIEAAYHKEFNELPAP